MIDPSMAQQAEQSVAFLSEYLSGMWWGLYEKCKEKGFTGDEALKLVQTYILSQGTGGGTK